MENSVKENPTIDWEQRRYEIAKACLAAFDTDRKYGWSEQGAGRAEWAVKEADALIAELKKKK